MELKFYIPYRWLAKHGYAKAQYSAYDANMPDIRERVLEILTAHTDGVFAAVVDKRGARDTWTPKRLGNYTFAQTLVLGVMREIGSDDRPTIIYDKGRLSQSSERSFESYLRHKQIDFADKHGIPHLLEPCPACSASSIHHPGIWAADYVAGAFYHKHQTSDAHYADILRPVWLGRVSGYIGIGEPMVIPIGHDLLSAFCGHGFPLTYSPIIYKDRWYKNRTRLRFFLWNTESCSPLAP